MEYKQLINKQNQPTYCNEAYNMGDEDVDSNCSDNENCFGAQFLEDKKKAVVAKKNHLKTYSMNDFKKFKYIESISSRYKLGTVLGEGAFGKVRRCILKDTGREFAIKII